MPPRRRAPAPIPVDVEGVRRKLAEGKIVRVGISKSAQFPDGATGRVRRVGDPAVDGEEFVQVELSLNGTRDILPFTPADLTPAVRGRRAGSMVAGSAKPAAPVRVTGTARNSGQATLTSVPTSDRSADSASNEYPDFPMPGAVATAGAGASSSGDSKAAVSGAGEKGPALPARESKAPAAGSSTSRPKQARGARRTPPVSITISTTDTEPPQWKIEARVGARVALRSGSVGPARVWELVRILENEALTKAVGSILDDQRKAAQVRADSLAAELAQVRAELDALPEPQ